MRRFRKILVYVECPDPAALAQVVELARSHGASLSVCDVIAPVPTLPDPTGVMSRLESLSIRYALERLRAMCAQHIEHVSIDYTVLTGVPFLAVTEQVTTQGFDLLAHVSRPNEDGGLNATGMHLMRKCPCAVWSLMPGRDSVPSNVVIAVDRHLDDTGTSSMAIAQASVARAITADARARLHIVHAWRPYAEQMLYDDRSGLTKAEIESCVDAQRREHERWLARLAEELAHEVPRCSIETYLERGDVTDVVTAVAEDTRAELIIMGTVGPSTVPGVLIGTSAEGILSCTCVSVLTLKPHGFSTPLRFTRKPSTRNSKRKAIA